ncbi:hypothetical protein [Streptomyces sp. NBC_01314]|uniref:hypothetical protein n=1 Tax=Streptomyces sp. NBC_01314 TaxID=2903821 RepID=UPI0030902BDE|nr:hypothetical protein OG622_29460 [Streptomyces sp. NBC_01314]
MARHPVRAGVVFGALWGGLTVWALAAFHDPVRLLQAVSIGLCGGLFVWLGCRLERRRQAHYAQNGGFRRDLPAPPVQGNARPVWFEGMVWLSHWAVYTVLFWLVGRLRNPPFDWVQSAFLAGFLIVLSSAVRLIKERRRRRGR